MSELMNEDLSQLLSRKDLAFLPPYEPPLTEAERQVAEIWAEHLRIDRVSRADDYFELGGDSFGAVAIALSLEKAFGVPFRSAAFIEFSTVSKQAEHMTSLTPAKPRHTELAGVQVSGGNPALFYIHGGMGTTFLSPGFLELLGPEQPVYFFRLPGIDGGEDPLPTVEAIAGRYVEQMMAVQPRGPYHVSANCSCAPLGLEVAQQLLGKGEAVASLILLDPSQAPTASARQAAKKKVQLLPWLRRRLERALAVIKSQEQIDWDKAVAEFSKKRGKAATLTRRLREIGAQADEQSFAEVSDEAISHALNLLIKALEDYHPHGHFAGRISILSSDERKHHADGWKELCAESVLYPIPGSHKAIFTDELPKMVAALRTVLGY